MSENCEKCGSSKNIETHHIRYIPERTVELCRSCHKNVHSNPQDEYHPVQKLNSIDGLDNSTVPNKATPTVKEINSNKYLYWQWRDGEKIKSEYIGNLNTLVENITSWTTTK